MLIAAFISNPCLLKTSLPLCALRNKLANFMGALLSQVTRGKNRFHLNQIRRSCLTVPLARVVIL